MHTHTHIYIYNKHALIPQNQIYIDVCGGVSVHVFNIFFFGVKEINLFSVKFSLEFQIISCDHSYKRHLFTHRHMALQISFSAPMIFSAVKKRLLNTICSGVDPEAHSSKVRTPPVQHADRKTHLCWQYWTLLPSHAGQNHLLLLVELSLICKAISWLVLHWDEFMVRTS